MWNGEEGRDVALLEPLLLHGLIGHTGASWDAAAADDEATRRLARLGLIAGELRHRSPVCSCPSKCDP